MAITINGARFLAYSRFRGLELRRTTVVGRQGLFAPPALLRPILHRHGLTVDPEDEAFFHGEMPEWADSLFRAFGSKELEFLDVSSYEGATRLHDLNRPVGDDWEESTDTLIDAGSLEHIFNVKTAMENYLRMVRIGGNIVLLDMPAVNLCGHGFYQFSPEFFCEVFSRRHGFELVSLALAEDWAYAPFFSVARPRERPWQGRTPWQCRLSHLLPRAEDLGISSLWGIHCAIRLRISVEQRIFFALRQWFTRCRAGIHAQDVATDRSWQLLEFFHKAQQSAGRPAHCHRAEAPTSSRSKSEAAPDTVFSSRYSCPWRSLGVIRRSSPQGHSQSEADPISRAMGRG